MIGYKTLGTSMNYSPMSPSLHDGYTRLKQYMLSKIGKVYK